ncbi:MAG: alkaline phosphatase family protein [Muribaculaceae bacterium]|nr:alkaline phosphatase family protein [Muribaculaceae bacterium]
MRKKGNRQKSSRLISSLALAVVAVTTTISVAAQTVAPHPAIVVNIIINGLDEECLALLHDHFPAGGFRRLTDEGVYFRSVDFGAPLDNAAATALIMTGADPSVNGVPAAVVYNVEAGKRQSVFFDQNFIGNFTNETYSPRRLAVSTLADEVKVNGGVTSYVHAIAASPEQAIALAGHAANSAFWINDTSGKWATSTYYKDVPQVVQTANYHYPLSSRIDTVAWRPVQSASKYPSLSRRLSLYPFNYTFSSRDNGCYRRFKASAKANSEIATAAANYIRNLNLGRHESTDMLNIVFNLQPYPYAKEPTARFETLDAYFRLDRDLSAIFSAITSTVGMKNAAVVVAGTPLKPAAIKDDPSYRIPTGTFSSRRAVSLLNMYLMAKYGNSQWVSAYFDCQFFLNRKAIDDARLDISAFRADAASFLAKMSGIVSATPVDRLSATRFVNAPEMGDIIVEVNPGWEIDEEDGSQPQVVRAEATHSVAMILAPELKPAVINNSIDAHLLAPTVARLLHIRSPNAAKAQPFIF